MNTSCFRRLVVTLLMGLSLSSFAHGLRTMEFTNGLWFDGRDFRPDTLYSVNGVLTRSRPASIDEVVDLGKTFVIPPFAEAHNHNVEGEWNIDPVIQKYLSDGVYYVKIVGQIPDFSAKLKDRINRPDSIDVTFSNGGFTGSGGHPMPLYRDILREHRYHAVVGNLDPHWFDKRAHFQVDSRQQLEAQWSRFLSTKPDLVKIYLVCSEVHDKPNNYCRDRRGLDPRLLPDIMELARKAKLSVVAHVETAGDFRAAVLAGVKEIGHLPGWFLFNAELAERARLTDEDAVLAAKENVIVHTTTVASWTMGGVRSGGSGGHGHGDGAHAHGQNNSNSMGSVPNKGGQHTGAQEAQAHVSDPRFAEVEKVEREVQIANLNLLKRHRVRIAIGTDHGDTPLSEVMNVRSMRIFSNLELIKAWTEDTALCVFPDRKIGKLDEGYEASFLVLEGNPIADFENVRRIRMRVKQGRVLVLGTASGQPRSHSH